MSNVEGFFAGNTRKKRAARHKVGTASNEPEVANNKKPEEGPVGTKFVKAHGETVTVTIKKQHGRG